MLHLRSACKVIDLTRSSGRMHRVPRLVCPWHTLGELRQSQFRVLGVALAVDNAEQRRLRGEMLAFLWTGFRRTDAVPWTHVTVASDESADGYPSGCIWNARGQLLPAAPACHQPRAWDTYARVRCVASQVRLQSERLDTVRRSGAPCPAFGAPMAHTG